MRSCRVGSLRRPVAAICEWLSAVDVRGISFAIRAVVRQRAGVRWPAFVCLALFWCGSVSAQDQERTLIDRLLRPNMELHNRAQGKAFTADSKVVGHAGAADTFVAEPAAKQKVFNDAHSASTKQYPSGSSKADLR